VLNFRIAEMPILLIPIGLGYAAIYYFVFRWVITKWNLRTPGREEEAEAIEASLGEEAAELVSGRQTTRPTTRRRDDDLPPIIDQPTDEQPR
jgi:PTS system N-acetylglucosamine-specific IIC component